MRVSIFLVGLMAGSTAKAHGGHFGDLAGHDHWVAAGAIGAAIALAGWNILKDKRKSKAEPETAADDAPQEA